MTGNDRSRADKVRSILRGTARVVESTLLSYYALPTEEAHKIEEELFLWFERLSRRPGVPDSFRALRTHLLSMTCKVAHVYWFGKTSSELPKNEMLRRTLALGPEIIASELEKDIEAQELKIKRDS
jgi:hypothetical protein